MNMSRFLVLVFVLKLSFVVSTEPRLKDNDQSIQLNSEKAKIILRIKRSVNESAQLMASSNHTNSSSSGPSPESDSISEPSPESTSEPSPESTSEPSPESDSTSEPSPESDSTSEPSPESYSTSEPSPESDSTSEPSPESDSTSEPSPESDSTSEPSPESTSEPSPESDSTSEPSPESYSTSEPSPESDSTSEPSPESDSTSEPIPESDSTSEPSPESDSTSEPSPESDSTSEPSPESDSTSEPSPESDSTSEPSPESDSTSEPSPESTSEPSPESTHEPSPESTSEPSPESDSTSEPSPESDSTSEPSPESDSTSEPSPESTSEPSPESTSEPSPESDSTSEPSPESDSTSEPSPESDSTSEPSPESDSTSEPIPESDSTSEPSPESDSTSEPSPESTSEPSPESTSEPSPESTSEPSPESDSTSEPSPESDSTSEPSPESDSTSEPSPESDSTSEPIPESDSTSEPSPESDSTSEPIPESDSTSEPSPESDSTYEPSPDSDSTSEPSPESDSTSEPSPESDSTSEPSPESDSTSEPIPESDSTSEPSPESDSTSEPSPESESTSEPSPESTSEPSPESTSEPSPESDSISEPSPESTHEPSPEDNKSDPGSAQSEPKPEPETWPEPAPEWEKAFKIWQNAWPAHTYLFAIIFLLMAFYSGYYIVFNVKDGVSKKYLSICLNVMMFILSITRSFLLFLDPYHQGTIIKDKLVLQIMWSIGTPCLLASDSLCILALAESASVNIVHQRFQRLSNILIVIFLHFVLVIATDVVVSSYTSAKALILYCQIFSIIWGSLLGYWYFALAHKINQVLFKAAGRRKSRADRVYLLLIYLSSAANLFTCVLILYSAVGVFGIYSEVEFVGAWSWYTLQTGFRVSEVIAAVLVFTVSAKRNRMRNKVHNAIVCGPSQVTKETADASSSNPTVDNLYPAARNRRMSMFSAVHQSKISAQDNSLSGNQLPWMQSSNTPVGGGNGNPAPRGRRMSLFSELHESKLSAAANVGATLQRNQPRNNFSGLHQSQGFAGDRGYLPTEEDNGKSRSLLHKTVRSVDNNENVPSSGNRRMSMFSQLQEIKLSANANNSTPSTLGSKRTPPSMINESVDKNQSMPKDNGRRMSMFSQLQELKMSANNSLPSAFEGKENNSNQSKHSNFFSKFFHTKVVPAGSTSPKTVSGLNKLTGLCRNDTSVETGSAGMDVNNTPDACKNVMKATEWRKSRTSLFAGLREANTKLDEMKIIEDEEEEAEAQDPQIFNRRKSSSRNRAVVIPMKNMNSDSPSISKDGDQLTQIDT